VCNRYSNTAKGVAEYLGQTKGTVSQSIKVLERKGLITKHVDNIDKRIVHLKITSNARTLLKKTVPAPLFSNAGKLIKEQSMKQMQSALKSLLMAVQKANGLKSFGVCHTCRYNQQLNNGNHLCRLTKEVLSSKEVQLICREHDDGEQVFSI
jgi:DNA-binding MarR family transcriptional regulator